MDRPAEELDALRSEEWASLEALGPARRFEQGSTLFREGDESDAVYALRAGRVRVSVATPGGRDLLLAVKGRGELVGELAAIDGRRRSATVTAIEVVEAVVVPAGAFDAFLDEHPRFAVRLLRTLAAQVRRSGAWAVDRTSADTPTRVARRLLDLADQQIEHGPARTSAVARGAATVLALTQEDLAGWVGATREATARALAELRRAGLVSTGRGHIVLVDRAGLEARADG